MSTQVGALVWDYNSEQANFCGLSRIHLREHSREHLREPFRGSIGVSYFAFASSVLHEWRMFKKIQWRRRAEIKLWFSVFWRDQTSPEAPSSLFLYWGYGEDSIFTGPNFIHPHPPNPESTLLGVGGVKGGGGRIKLLPVEPQNIYPHLSTLCPSPCPSLPWCFCFFGVFYAVKFLGLFECFLLIFQCF